MSAFGFAGRYVWWAVGFFVVSLVLFISFRSGPRLYSGPSATTTIGDIKEILAGLGTVLGFVVTIMGFINEWFFKKRQGPEAASAEIRNGPFIGQQMERVIRYEGDYEVVSVETFAGYNPDGRQRWELGEEYRRRRRG